MVTASSWTTTPLSDTISATRLPTKFVIGVMRRYKAGLIAVAKDAASVAPFTMLSERGVGLAVSSDED